MPAIAFLTALSSAIGRRCLVRPKRQDDWTITPNLWGVIVGRPGSRKSPAVREALQPLYQLEDRAYKDFEREQRAYEEMVSVRDESGVEDPPKPTAKRYYVNEPTVQKLLVIMRDNPQGVLLLRDEWDGFARQLSKQGREGDRAFYLEAWNGNSPYSADTLSRGTIRASIVCLSILGTVQPGPLSDFVREAVIGGKGADGLLARFQLAVYPDPVDYKFVARLPNNAATEAVYRLFGRLDELRRSDFDENIEQVADSPPFLRFAAEAQPMVNDWLCKNAAIIEREDDALAEHFSKYNKLLPALALILELADWASAEASTPLRSISLASAKRAEGWCDLLREHARRIYRLDSNGTESPAILLARKILAGKLGDRFTRRDLLRRCWRGLDDKVVDDALKQLCDEWSWLQQVTRKTRGRPRVEFVVNPKVQRQEGTELLESRALGSNV
ncbi:MAG: DUF3987 domain-containing protein [Proteobacteria bacterium]|nr:DUF3987 domain-containing protein [Pseudomonadota bacterium]